MVEITITQPLALIHWNIAAPMKVIGPLRRPPSSGLTGSAMAIAAAR